MAEKDFIIEEKTTEETKEEVKEETPLEDVVLETEGGTKSLLGATSGTDIAATSLDTKTTPAGTDNLILFNQNTNVGYQIDYDNLADAILNKITSKTYANQVGGSSAATLLAQLSTLNSNKASSDRIMYIDSSKDILTSIENISTSGLVVGTASGGSYEGRTPNGSNPYKYGSFICMRRGPNAIALLWFPESVSADRPIFYLSHTSGDWSNCYPLTYGSTAIPLA